MSASEIRLEYIEVPGAGPAVLIPEARIKVVSERNKTRIKELSKSVAGLEAEIESASSTEDRRLEAKVERDEALASIAALEAQTEFAVKGSKALRDKYKDQIQVKVYPFKPYTWGEKNTANSRATSYDSGDPRLDVFRLRVLLVAFSTGLSESEIEALPPALGEALASEVMERTEPDPNRLDFLSS